MTYTKLAHAILTSTIWVEDSETRIVWITLLASANRYGEVQASIPGLASLARVPVDLCRTAIAKFLAPDPDSRTKEDEGRRLQEIDGGWLILTYEKHRALASDEDRKLKAAIRQQRSRDKKRAANDVTPESRTVTPESPQFGYAEADTDTDQKNPPTPLRGKRAPRAAAEPPPLPSALDTPDVRAALDAYQAARREQGHKPLGPTGLRQLYDKLAGWGALRALAALRHSTANGWQGVFEEKGSPNRSAPVNGRAIDKAAETAEYLAELRRSPRRGPLRPLAEMLAEEKQKLLEKNP